MTRLEELQKQQIDIASAIAVEVKRSEDAANKGDASALKNRDMLEAKLQKR